MLLVLSSCITTYDINTACDKISETQYNLKWETDSDINGYVKVFVSDNAESFDKTRPEQTIPINNNIAAFDFEDIIVRPYFLMQFNDSYERVVSERHIRFENINNFRDMGGYSSSKAKHVKWGMLYRSGTLDSMTIYDAEKIKALKINTYVDMCTYSDSSDISYKRAGIKKHLHLPIDAGDNFLFERLASGNFRYSDVNDTFMMIFGNMVRNNGDMVKKIFDTMLEEDNYPIVLGCNYGLLQSSFISLLIFTALEVPDHIIYEDYLLNNKMFDFSYLAEAVKDYPEEAQLAVMYLSESESEKLKKVFNIIRKEYGSRDEFFKSLGIDDNYRARLRKVLLN